jgi:hypothetical protein
MFLGTEYLQARDEMIQDFVEGVAFPAVHDSIAEKSDFPVSAGPIGNRRLS